MAHRERPEHHEELPDERVEPGQPDAREHDEQERAEQPRHHAREPAHLGELAGVRAFVDHPDQQEQRPRREAVVHHLQDAAGDRLLREREDPEDHEAEVRDARVRHEPFHVGLHQRADRAVDDADHRQHRHERREVLRGLGEQRQVEPEQAVGADLQQDAGQQDRAGGRRLGVRVGQPRVQREQRHLHRERHEEREEEPARGLHRQPRGHLRELPHVERGVAALPRPRVQEQDRDQQERRAGHREQEELDRGVDAVRAPPAADDQVHRDQDRLEEQEEQQQVERQERAEHRRLQRQDRRHVARARSGRSSTTPGSRSGTGTCSAGRATG